MENYKVKRRHSHDLIIRDKLHSHLEQKFEHFGINQYDNL